MSKPRPDEMNVFESLCSEVDSGPLSILSDKARDRIKLLIRLAVEDGFRRGAAMKEATGSPEVRP